MPHSKSQIAIVLPISCFFINLGSNQTLQAQFQHGTHHSISEESGLANILEYNTINYYSINTHTAQNYSR